MNENNIHKYYLAIRDYLISVFLCILILIWSLKLYAADLRIPLAYDGDAIYFYTLTKTIMDTGWVFSNDYIGAPYGLELYDFPMNNILDVLIIKLILFFTSDYILSENIFYLLTYPITTITSMIVFRQFKLNFAYSLLGSLLFTFMPYHFLRGLVHLNLSSYFLVPLMIMVVLWLCSFNVSLLRLDPKLIVSVIICILSGCVFFYYPFFFCFFLLIAGVLSSAMTHRMAPILTSLVLILIIFIVILINQLPTILYQYQNGMNIDASVRLPFETEYYGLKIIQLLLPIEGHRIPIFARIAQYYDSTAPLVNENSIASLGIIGGLGFLLLIGFIFFRTCHVASKWDCDLSILNELSVLNLSAVLFAAIGGFSSITAYAGLAQFRCVNRISIFIAFFSIFAILVALRYASNNYTYIFKSKKNICIIVGLLLLIGIFDQTSASFVPPYASIKEEYISDDQFVNSIAAVLPENSMIFQLPYASFPGYPAIYRMGDYSHLKGGYLHSRDLRWSYGSMKGRSGDRWQRLVAGMPMLDMINTLSLFGFSGIYIDSYGYEDGAVQLLSDITSILKVKPIVSNNKRLYFLNMNGYNQKRTINSSKSQKIYMEFGTGWYSIEDHSGVQGRWMQGDATILALSPDNRTANLSLQALSFYRKRTLEIASNGAFAAKVAVPTVLINVSMPVKLSKGVNTLRLHVPECCERPSNLRELNNNDERCLSIAVKNLIII